MTGLRTRFHALFVLWLTIMWVLLMGEISIGNIVAGFLLGSAIVLFLPMPRVPRGNHGVRWTKLLTFILRWIADLMVASAKVAWLALRPQSPPKSAILQVPMRVSNDLIMYLATCAYNLQPGGSVSDIDVANRIWTIHVLDANDVEREKDSVARLEQDMIEIFESKG